ncbi:protein translocase subunit SecD [bacterium]|nr:protein translocase subunit SecD [bacterium]
MEKNRRRWLWIAGVLALVMSGPVFRVSQGTSLVQLGLDLSGGVDLLIKVSPPPEATLAEVIPSVVDVLGKRLDPQGTLSISVQQVGPDRVGIQVPASAGEDPMRVRRLVEQSAHLELVDTGHRSYLQGDKACREPDPSCAFVYSITQTIISGEDLVRAAVTPDPNRPGSWQVAFDLRAGEASNRFGRHTASHIGQYLTIVLDGIVQSSPSITSAIYGGSGRITGGYSVEGANELSTLLNAGRLRADVDILRMASVGPTLGKVSLDRSLKAGLIGLGLVALFMVVLYRKRGFVAVVSLALFALLLFSLISDFNITLTLPGIAGLILSLGMAVDATIIIFERIKEEERGGATTQKAIRGGFANAHSVIIDANVTTLLIGLVLYSLATGPVRGFAVTLCLGIAVSLFTALVVTRALLTRENA